MAEAISTPCPDLQTNCLMTIFADRDLLNRWPLNFATEQRLLAKVNGTTAVCEGLSQWGSQNLAQQGLSSQQILQNYYGNIETVLNAPVRDLISSYPGTPIRRGSSGPNVVTLQVALNRIAQNYPAIPKIPAIDGIYGSQTEASVRKFQEVFDLSADGIVGPATWYAIVRLYTAVTSLSELRSQGQKYYAINWNPPDTLRLGSTGDKVRLLQYMLTVLSNFISEIPPISIDGIYGNATRAAVLSAQRYFRLPETGVVDTDVWNEIYDQYSGIENTVLRSGESFPTQPQTNRQPPAASQTNTGTMRQFPGYALRSGQQDIIRQEVVR